MFLLIPTLIYWSLVSIKDVPAQSGPLDFRSAVGLALKQSPLFTGTSIEIAIRHLDESDSRYSLIPSLTLKATHYFNAADTVNDASGWSIILATEPYNPVMSYFSIGVSKIITRMAVFGHEKAIAQGVNVLAQKFLQLDNLENMIVLQDELIALRRRGQEFEDKRREIGAAARLETQIAAQELALALAERDSLTAFRAALLEELSAVLGLETVSPTDLDLAQSLSQIMSRFDPAKTRLDEVRAKSFDLKIQDLRKELQAKKVTLSYMSFIPTMTLGLRNPDPLTEARSEKDYFFMLGIDLPLWQG
ncbi:MAG: hypothetical protein V1742_06205, partial [Pseudomonadota bacterium]